MQGVPCDNANIGSVKSNMMPDEIYEMVFLGILNEDSAAYAASSGRLSNNTVSFEPTPSR